MRCRIPHLSFTFKLIFYNSIISAHHFLYFKQHTKPQSIEAHFVRHGINKRPHRVLPPRTETIRRNPTNLTPRHRPLQVRPVRRLRPLQIHLLPIGLPPLPRFKPHLSFKSRLRLKPIPIPNLMWETNRTSIRRGEMPTGCRSRIFRSYAPPPYQTVLQQPQVPRRAVEAAIACSAIEYSSAITNSSALVN
jgi:hypothetical protein